MDEMIKVYEEDGSGRVWLQDVLDDNGIPYRAEADCYWTGIKVTTYHDKVCIYVPEKYREVVQGFIDEYSNADNIAWEDMGEGDLDDLPQIRCASCCKDFDFDYPKCPFCGCSVQA